MSAAVKKLWTQADRDLPQRLKEKLAPRIAGKQLAEIKLKSFDPAKPLRISGYANVAVADRMNEVMPKDCWNLENYLKNPVILSGHNQWEPTAAIGNAEKVEPQDKGLYLEAVIGNPEAGYPLTQVQEDIRSLVAQGVLKSFSVGFLAHEWKYDEDSDTLTYTNVELLEISIVSIPCQQDSQIESVKRFDPKTQTPNRKGVKNMDEELGKKVDALTAKVDALTPKIDEVLAAVKALAEKGATPEAPKEDEEAKALKAELEKVKAENAELTAQLTNAIDLIEEAAKQG